jgi:hypothetical protein
MDFLTTLFLESPIWLGVFSFLLFAAALFLRLRLEGSARNRCLPLTLIAIVLLFILEGMVTTQRERIWETMDGFIVAIQQPDAPAASQYISIDYESGKMDRDAMAAYIEEALTDIRVLDSQILRRDVTIDGDLAEMVLAVRANVSIRGQAGQLHAGTWKIGWQRSSDGWRIRSVVPTVIDTIPVGDLKTLRELSRQQGSI